MKRMRWTIMLALLGFLMAGLVIWALVPKEPAYQGRSLSSWLDEWGKSSNDRTNPATIAIRAIGSNGVPILLARLSWNEPTSEIKFLQFAHNFIPGGWTEYHSDSREVTAARGINFLGTEARSAFPTLTNLVFSSRAHQTASAIALAGLGHEGVAVLLGALTNQDWRLRFSAAFALGEARSDLDEVIPALIDAAKTKSSKQDDYLVLGQAGNSLLRLHAKPELVVPVLSEFLSSPDAWTRIAGARLLGSLGTNAYAAVPQLLKARTDLNADVRRDAERALEKIDPQAASQSTNVLKP